MIFSRGFRPQAGLKAAGILHRFVPAKGLPSPRQIKGLPLKMALGICLPFDP